MAIRDDIMKRLWRGVNPYYGFPLATVPVDTQGWGSTHPYLRDKTPHEGRYVIVEVGVWKGASSIHMAEALRDRNVDGCVIAVDTWLGSADHWAADGWWSELGMQFGYPSLQRKFMRNVLEARLSDYIVPLPLDSINASSVIFNFGIRPDIVHIDGGHEYASVRSDLVAW
jgi:hypothetical protein